MVSVRNNFRPTQCRQLTGILRNGHTGHPGVPVRLPSRESLPIGPREGCCCATTPENNAGQKTGKTCTEKNQGQKGRGNSRFLERPVDCDTSTEDRTGLVEGQTIWNLGQIPGGVQRVPLESTVNPVAARHVFGTVDLMTLVTTSGQYAPRMCVKVRRKTHLVAVVAIQTSIGNPFDSNPVADLDILFCARRSSDNDTGALVSTDKGQLDREGPVSFEGMEVTVAHARENVLPRGRCNTSFNKGTMLIL